MKASLQDYSECEQLHRTHGTSYYFATKLFPTHLRPHVHALYGFVRLADEIVDDQRRAQPEDRLQQLQEIRKELDQAPTHPVMRAFQLTMEKCQIDRNEARIFLDAMEMDLKITRYPTYKDLEDYMRGSAAAVGLMMCDIMRIPNDPPIRESAMKLGNAMQVTNFLRDVAEDARRGRIYLPLEDLQRHGVPEADIMEGRFTPEFKALMQEEITRTRKLYAEADVGIARLPVEVRKAVRTARLLYSMILDEIEKLDHNVFSQRARTSKWKKIWTAVRVVFDP